MAPLFDVVVIGAGQAGLSAADRLVRRGLVPGEDFVVLDANEGPGGAWRHRWESLTLGRAHGIHDLPGLAMGPPDPTEPARIAVPRYYGAYEQKLSLAVRRPASVKRVTRLERPSSARQEDHDGEFLLSTDQAGDFRARAIINATGTWDNPYVPYYPGIADFRGTQLHTRSFRAAADFRDQRVLVVGGGASATQFIMMLQNAGAETVWTTRRTPQWNEQSFDATWGIAVEKAVTARTTRGLPPLSVVGATGLASTPEYMQAMRAGWLISRGPLIRFTATGAVLQGPGPDGAGVPSQGAVGDRLLAEGAGRGGLERVATLPGNTPDSPALDTEWEVPIDVVLWATGFRAALRHLSPLGLRQPGGGVLMDADTVSVVGHRGLFLVGYGASASTIGATRAGRRAALKALDFLQDTHHPAQVK